MNTLMLVAALALPSWAQDDASCQQAGVCDSHGACFARDGRCVATVASCPTSRACLERGRCLFHGDRCLTSVEFNAAAQSLIASLGVSEEDSVVHDVFADEHLPPVEVESAGVASLVDVPASEGLELHRVGTRPHRQLDPAAVSCPPDARRLTETSPERDQLVWCALPDGRKKGPELLIYAGGGQRVYTEYLLDQEHGEHVITEGDGRVMVLGRFELGREQGEWQSWYIGGDRASRGEYHAGKKQGIWTEWSRDGDETLCDYRDPAVPDVQCVAPKD